MYRKRLWHCTKANYIQPSKDAVEVDAGILPLDLLDLGFLEISEGGMAKIAAKPPDNPLQHQMNKNLQDDNWDDGSTPMGLAASQITEMKRMTDSGVEFIQPGQNL